MDMNTIMISVLSICTFLLVFMLLVFITERKFIPYSAKFFIVMNITLALSFFYNDFSYIFEHLRIAETHDSAFILTSILCSFAFCIAAGFYPDGLIYEGEIRNRDIILKSGGTRRHYVFGIVASAVILAQITCILILFINGKLYEIVDFQFIELEGYIFYYIFLFADCLAVTVYVLFRMKKIGKLNTVFLLLFFGIILTGSVFDLIYMQDIYMDLSATIAMTVEFVYIQKLSMNRIRQGKLNSELSIIEQNSVVVGLVDDYEGIVYVIIDHKDGNDIAHENRINGAFNEYIPDIKKINSIYERLSLIGRELVIPRERDEYLTNVSRSSILENIAIGSSYQVSFKVKLKDGIHNYRLKFIASRDSEGSLIGYTVGLLNADKQVSDIQTEKAYQQAILTNAYCYYRVDFTQDKVNGSIVERIEGKLFTHESALPSYQASVLSYAEKFLKDEDKKDFIQKTSVDYMQKCFEEGNYMPEFTVKVTDKDDYFKYRRYVTYLSKDERNENLLGMVVVYDVTNQVRIEHEILQRNKQEMTISRCIKAISDYGSEGSALESLLEIIVDYYQAERACVFEVNKRTGCFELNYEWCRPELRTDKQVKFIIPYTESNFLKDRFDADKFVERDIVNNPQAGSERTVPFLQQTKINTYLSVGIKFNKEIVGFLGVANPQYDTNGVYLLNSVATLAYGEITKMNQLSEEAITLNVISKGFHSVYFVDFNTDYMHMYYTRQSNNFSYDSVTSYSGVRQEFLQSNVAAEDIERCSLVTSPEFIMKQFENQTSFAFSYINISSGRRLNFTVEYIKANEDGSRAVVCLNDVTEILKTENEAKERLEKAMVQAKSASNAKSTFMFNMSHDIRTPMNAITGFTHMAKKHIDEKEKVNEYLDKIDTASKQLLSLINEVLEMSRIESGKAEINLVPLNISEKVNNTITIVSSQAEAKGISFSGGVRNIVHNEVMADDTKLGQISLNILGNAIKYTPSGGKVSYIVEELADEPAMPGQSVYRIVVEDNGIGMSEKYLATIFEPFSRERTSTISKIQGTGLGMSIVKELVELLDGNIDIESKQNVGTKVTITIPLNISDRSAVSDIEPSSDEIKVLEGKRVLLVEDNELNREIARDILEEYGVIIDEAEDGEAAVKKYVDTLYKGMAEAYDFILMDIQMPKMNGIEASRAIRDLPLMNNRKRVPIIAMTANAFDEDRQLSIEAGMDAHLAKPINIKSLVETMITLL